MKILNFHIRGKIAHFRRYYSNSSALSYSVPPRTTLIGLIAGLMGFERDSYYGDFGPEECRVAVGVCSPQKKLVQTLNLLMIKSSNDLNGSQQHHSQTPTELIIPTNIRTGFLDYEVWICHQNNDLIHTLHTRLEQKYGYLTKGVSAALGTAQHLGWAESARIVEGEEVAEAQADFFSILPVSNVISLHLSESRHQIRLQKEDMPIHFHSDRTIARKGNFLINVSAAPVNAKVKTAVRLSDERFIMWMED